MKKLLYFMFAATLSCLVLSCDDDNDGLEVSLSVDKDAIEAPVEGGSYQVNVTSNVPWSAKVTDAENNIWCTLKNATAEGDGAFTVKVNENFGPQRSATVTVYAGNETRIITVTQEEAIAETTDPVTYNVAFDNIITYSYYGDFNDTGSGFVTLQFATDSFDYTNNPTAAGSFLSMDCYMVMADDPQNAKLPEGDYAAGTLAAGTPKTYALDSPNTYIKIYDDNLKETIFKIESGTFTVTDDSGTFAFEGEFADDKGNKFIWTARKAFKLFNFYDISVDPDGYRIVRANALLSAGYEGDIEGFSSGRASFDIIDPVSRYGFDLTFFIDKNQDPENVILDEGDYTVAEGGAPRSIKKGDMPSDYSSLKGSYYYVSLGSKTVQGLVNGGKFNVKKVGNGYDIRIDLTVDGGGNVVEPIKIRYMGNIKFANKMPRTIEFEPTLISTQYAGTIADGTIGDYRIVLRTGKDFTKNTQHMAMTLRGDPSTGTPEPTVGTYHLSENNERLTFAPHNFASYFNPMGTFYYAFNSSTLRENHGITGGSITIEKATGSDYKIIVDLVGFDDASKTIGFYKTEYVGPVTF